MRLGVLLHQLACHAVDLHGQLPGGGDDQGPRAVAWLELGAVQQLHAGYEEGQRLARACGSLLA